MDQAGQGVARAAAKRHLTVLRVDLVDSTRLFKSDDPELIDRMVRLTEDLEEIALAHGAKVDHAEADSSQFLFDQLPVLEDVSMQAQRAALRMQARAGAFAREDGEPFRLRIGIATGEVTTGVRVRQGKDLRELLWGALSPLCERLRAAAPAGGTVVCEATHRLTPNAFSYGEPGVCTGKGFEEERPRFWPLLAARRTASRFEGQDHVDRIVGRAAIRATLAADWAAARAGGTRAVLLHGEAGIGKSTLAHEVLDRAAAQQARRIVLQCAAGTEDIPLHPVCAALRHHAGIDGGDTEDVRERKIGALLAGPLAHPAAGAAARTLAALVGTADAAANRVPPENVREGTLAALVALFDCLACGGPLVVLVEDLHWADASTAQLLAALSRRLQRRALLLLATTRDLAAPGVRGVPYERIALPPMPPQEAVEVVHAVAAGHPLGEAVVRDIVRRAEGLPLALKELAHNAVAGLLVDGAPRRCAAGVPIAMQLVVESRMGRIPDLEDVVCAAAILGNEFPVGWLRAMLPEGAPVISACLDRIVAAGLFAERERKDDATEVGHFRHGLFAEAVRATIGSKLKAWHAKAADALLDARRQGEDVPDETLATHLREARWRPGLAA
jgi:class 3 adenylate cyclase